MDPYYQTSPELKEAPELKESGPELVVDSELPTAARLSAPQAVHTKAAPACLTPDMPRLRSYVAPAVMLHVLAIFFLMVVPMPERAKSVLAVRYVEINLESPMLAGGEQAPKNDTLLNTPREKDFVAFRKRIVVSGGRRQSTITRVPRQKDPAQLAKISIARMTETASSNSDQVKPRSAPIDEFEVHTPIAAATSSAATEDQLDVGAIELVERLNPTAWHTWGPFMYGANCFGEPENYELSWSPSEGLTEDARPFVVAYADAFKFQDCAWFELTFRHSPSGYAKYHRRAVEKAKSAIPIMSKIQSGLIESGASNTVLAAAAENMAFIYALAGDGKNCLQQHEQFVKLSDHSFLGHHAHHLSSLLCEGGSWDEAILVTKSVENLQMLEFEKWYGPGVLDDWKYQPDAQYARSDISMFLKHKGSKIFKADATNSGL